MNTIAVDRKLITPLSIRRQWISVLHLVLEWGLIAVLIYINNVLWNPFLYILSVLLIGASMQSFVVLSHEAVHYMLLTNRKWNDWVGELFITYPLFYSLKHYRSYHFLHHKHLNTEKDPDYKFQSYPEFQFPLTTKKALWILLLDLTGINFMKYKLAYIVKGGLLDLIKSASIKVSLYYVIIGGAILYSGYWKEFLLFWLVPYATWFQAIYRLRTVAEHNAIYIPNKYGTRTVLTNMLDKIFIGPKNANFHIEHHLYPNVPFYNLPKLHNLLMTDSSYRDNAYLSKGYWGAILDIIQYKPNK